MSGKTFQADSIASTEELMAWSLAIEKEAVERFTDLADVMEIHNNHEVADLFRKLAEIEGLHVNNVSQASGDMLLPTIQSWAFEWADGESPEGGAMEEAHYLMHPWHAIQLAIRGEQRAVAFFNHVASASTNEKLTALALDLVAEEEEHVALLEDWLKRYPKPEEGWDDDPDPPMMQE